MHFCRIQIMTRQQRHNHTCKHTTKGKKRRLNRGINGKKLLAWMTISHTIIVVICFHTRSRFKNERRRRISLENACMDRSEAQRIVFYLLCSSSSSIYLATPSKVERTSRFLQTCFLTFKSRIFTLRFKEIMKIDRVQKILIAFFSLAFTTTLDRN